MNKQTNEILGIFEQFRMSPTPLDQYHQVGKSLLAQKIDAYVASHSTINFVMLGYPMKSSNDRDKVIGKLPDLAEEVSLKNFERFNKLVKEIYSPGVNINIVNDGYVFNDLLEVEDRTVAEYQEISTDMGKDAPMLWWNLMDFYGKKHGSLSSMRGAVMEDFGVTNQELERRILMDPDVNFLYRGMIRFMMEELAVKSFPSGNQLQKAAKVLTRNMMMRNEAYSNLVKKEFSSHIRLSMHPSINNGAKYSFQLIPGEKAFRSPWHCALYIDQEGQYVTVHKKEAEQQGLHLVMKDNRPYYYTSK